MSEILDETELRDKLTDDLPDWSAEGDGITRVAELPTFPDAITVVARVGVVAEEMDHHPDIDIRWRTLTFRCSTHSEGGVTSKDLDLARQIDEIIAAES
ncbi:4a-hydroxytetrahydrobiopterin dehydratase [Phytomonospora endophytica]|uniref:Putative pterin-4-alpha-carbinolamine dehydratase n=1 Tax=Phytomonospora endophytica TaxID=714109 RepID=A0A841G1C9_9ACTN|nr:4a-hydroxytetrahydrobiopterin dehydratase [Phytomonospora endophytica]MBB6038479.1 4a-hydroxytetrahydrobiopterin dehydratase [Phytomonospora endophytica]GIG64408.1 4a-hydroxytetrahydrobiopterin dehydratase [Phytomonospora endophytica]